MSTLKAILVLIIAGATLVQPQETVCPLKEAAAARVGTTVFRRTCCLYGVLTLATSPLTDPVRVP